MATQTPARDMILRPTAFKVASETKPGVTYRVQLPDCECPDFEWRKTHKPGTFCKHLRRALELAGWQLPASRDTSRLDWEAAADLLADFKVSKKAAEAALGRAQVSRQGSHLDVADGTVVIVYSKSAGTFDVRLPA